MNQSQTSATGTLDKGRRLASIISKGYGYFETKQALEENDWDVDKAVASLSATHAQHSTIESEQDENSQPVTKSSTKSDNENANVKPPPSMDWEHPHSIRPKHAPWPSLSAAIIMNDQRHQAASTQRPELEDTAEDENVPNNGSDETVEIEPSDSPDSPDHPKPNEARFVAADGGAAIAGINGNVSPVPCAIPAAFEDGHDDTISAITGWESIFQSSQANVNPLAPVVEGASKPEIDSATQEASTDLRSIMRNDGSNLEAASDGSKVKSATNKWTSVPKGRRRLFWFLLLALLVIFGIVIGVVVSKQNHSERADEVGAGGPTSSSTTSPSPDITSSAPTTPSPTIARPTSTTSPGPTASPTQDTQTSSSPSVGPSSLPTTVPPTLVTTSFPSTMVPTTTPTLPSTQQPTDPPTSPPTDPPTTPSPTKQPTDSPTTSPPTTTPTFEPTDSPTTSPPMIPPTSELTDSPTTRPPSPTPPTDLSGEVTDPAGDADTLDFTSMSVSATEDAVFIELEFYGDPRDLYATIYMYGDSEDELTISGCTTSSCDLSWNRRRNLDGASFVTRSEHSYVRGGKYRRNLQIRGTASLYFSRNRMRDLQDKQIWIESNISDDRMPDEDETPPYLTLS